jgi:hypothetical protein
VSDARTERIDGAVARAGELIGVLLDLGPINPAQARAIVEGVVRAEIPNFQDWEVRDAASRIVGDGANGTNSTTG